MRPWQLLATTARTSLLVAGGLLTLCPETAQATKGCTPPACAADGTCRPNRREWGWYHTHWRPWPGEQVGLTPDAAGAPDAASGEEGGLPGILLPDPTKEDTAGAEQAERAEAGAAGAMPGEGSLPIEGELPPGDGVLPPGGDAPEVAPFGRATPPQNGAVQAAASISQPIELLPPTPINVATPAAYGETTPVSVQPLPEVLPADSYVAPAVITLPPAAPAPHGGDAPPALPTSLLNVSQSTGLQPRVTALPNARPAAPLRSLPRQQTAPGAAVVQQPIALGQPGSIRPAADVRPVSWQQPGGIALVNPVGAVAVEPEAEGAQRAIYYEVSDDANVKAQ